MTDVSLQEALSDLPNVGKVDVIRTNDNHDLGSHYIFVFKNSYGEILLMSASDLSITISRSEGQYSSRFKVQ